MKIATHKRRMIPRCPDPDVHYQSQFNVHLNQYPMSIYYVPCTVLRENTTENLFLSSYTFVGRSKSQLLQYNLRRKKAEVEDEVHRGTLKSAVGFVVGGGGTS